MSDTCPALFHEFLAETGLRFGEAQEVRWGDLDLGTRRLHVERRFYRGGVALPKGRKKRWVRLIEPMAQALWTLRKETRAGEEDLVFTSERGVRLDHSNMLGRILRPAVPLEPVETELPALAEVTTG